MGFLGPQNLLWGASLALLVLIYLRSRSRPTIDVSSLLLFDEAPAPVARVRQVRIDLLFWLEMAALGALTLAIAGLYAKLPQSPGQGRSRAFVFDLGAGMSARDGGGQRLDKAKRDAERIVSAAPAGDEFSVIDYALDAEVRLPQTANLALVRSAIEALRPMAVPARSAALAAALMRAQGAAEIDVFADRPLPAGALDDAGAAARVHFHRVGQPEDNLAIVSLDPGTPGIARGRLVVRNFADRPHLCELAIDLGGAEVMHHSLILARHEQMVIPFGPLRQSGLLRARITTADAIEADNVHYAYVPSDAAARVLVLSTDEKVRNDLAQVLLAINANFRIETTDPAKYRAGREGKAAERFELAVMHDCYLPEVAASAVLLIYPPATVGIPGMSVTGSLGNAEMRARSPEGGLAGNALTLGATRLVEVPEWMDVPMTARSGERGPFPAAALGRAASGRLGIVAFDIRNHFLLDPDHLDALVVAVDLIKRLVAPRDLQVISTGAYVSVPASISARLTEPDGATRTIAADRSGRVRIRALQAGRYAIDSAGATVQVLANYYDASESDLSAEPRAAASAKGVTASETSRGSLPSEIRPLALVLIALALAFVIESAMLLRHASRWGMRHV